ncbi:MAG TPA: DUF2461 domain-containing protein [Saprospiraceae bacterium]|nr:DUF2461 domain-containing protein [Saprospiraceae bacterium]
MGALSKHFTSFFKELAAHNNREWFNTNKQRFEEHVKEPFEKLTIEIIALMHKSDPQIALTAKDAVFRIHRDTRFAADKTPYKTHMSAVVGRGGRKDHSYPGLYYQIGVDGLAIAGGCWEPDKDRLTRIRAAIAADPKRIRKILDNKKFKETFGNIGGEKNKIIAKEFQKAGETVPEIYNKSFHYWTEYKSQKDVQRDDLAKFIVDHFKVAKEFNEFLLETM